MGMSQSQPIIETDSAPASLPTTSPLPATVLELDPKIMELLELFTYTQQKINDHLEKAFAADNLSLAHYRALFFIMRYPGISVSALIDKLNITKQSLARVLSDLIRGRGGQPVLTDEQMTNLAIIEGGYVYARVDESDRRARQLFLTTQGAELMHMALTPVAEAMRRSFSAAGHSFGQKDA